MSKPSQATRLVELVEQSHAYFFHTPNEIAFAKLDMGSHFEVWEVRRKVFRRWLARLFYSDSAQAPGSQAVQDAVAVIEGKALFEGDAHEVHVRLAHKGNDIYLDRADPKWQVVKITDQGWSIDPIDSEILFRRPAGMLELPHPEEGGSLDELREFVNVDDSQWPLVAGWLVGTFSRGPYPILDLLGQQGSAKSTTARVLRSMVDPNASPLRAEPREVRDLMVAANHGLILGWDNLSKIPDWLSDSICRLSTGGGFSTRELYSDSEEVIFDARRPVLINGIGELLTRGDALDRCLLIYLSEITEEARLEEEEFWRSFEEARPRILGALLDAVVGALRERRHVSLKRKPRMADFAMWVVAAEPDLGLPEGAFIKAYEANRHAAHQIALEANQVADVIVRFLDRHKGAWQGTATELLAGINRVASEDLQRLKDWPKSATATGNEISRLAPNLASAGVIVSRDRAHGRRLILLEKVRTDRESGGTSGTLEDSGDGSDTSDTRIPTQSSFGAGVAS